jgi:hypothetical protein
MQKIDAAVAHVFLRETKWQIFAHLFTPKLNHAANYPRWQSYENEHACMPRLNGISDHESYATVSVRLLSISLAVYEEHSAPTAPLLNVTAP